MNYEVIVIGGGPAGAYSASLLSKYGYSVLLIEAGPYKRYKVCSGGTPFRSIELLSKLGNPSKIVESEIKGVNIFIEDKEVISTYKEKPIGYSYYRSELDQWIRDRASDLGSIVYHETVAKRIKIENDGVLVKCYQRGLAIDFKGKLLIGAFGIRPDLLLQLGIKPTEYLISVQSEFKGDIQHIEDQIRSSFNFLIHPEFSTFSYGWIFPKSEGLSIGITDRMEGSVVLERFKKMLSKHPIVKEKIKNMKIMQVNGKEVLAHLNPNKPLERTYGRRFVLVGDAAGFADPITWEGIYFALKSGEIAANAFSILLERGNIDENSTSLYEKMWKKDFGKVFEIEWAVKQLLWGKNLTDRWLTIAKFFKSKKGRYKLLKEELAISMSIAPVIKKMSTIEKLNIGFKLKGYKLLRNPINFVYIFKTLFS